MNHYCLNHLCVLPNGPIYRGGGVHSLASNWYGQHPHPDWLISYTCVHTAWRCLFYAKRFLIGVVPTENLLVFTRVLWRVCRGNVFVKHAQIEEPLEDPITVSVHTCTLYVCVHVCVHVCVLLSVCCVCERYEYCVCACRYGCGLILINAHPFLRVTQLWRVFLSSSFKENSSTLVSRSFVMGRWLCV